MLLRTFSAAALCGCLMVSAAAPAAAQTLSSAVYRTTTTASPLKKPAVAKPSAATRAVLMRAAYRTGFQDTYPAPGPYPSRARPQRARAIPR